MSTVGFVEYKGLTLTDTAQPSTQAIPARITEIVLNFAYQPSSGNGGSQSVNPIRIHYDGRNLREGSPTRILPRTPGVYYLYITYVLPILLIVDYSILL